jgi:hypothetical protein
VVLLGQQTALRALSASWRGEEEESDHGLRWCEPGLGLRPAPTAAAA